MEKRRLEIASFVVLGALIVILTFLVFKPFLNIIVLAIVLALLFQPLYQRMLHAYSKGKNLFALVIVFLTLIFIILPILFFGIQIFKELQNLFVLLQYNQGQYLQTIQNTIESLVHPFFPNFTFVISEYVSTIFNFASNNFTGVLSQTANILFQTIFLMLAFFFFLRDGEKMFTSFISLSPFEKEQNKEIFSSIHAAITSVLRGTLVVGLVRWILLTIVLYMFGIPNALVWGVLAGIIGIIPGIGTPFIIIPTVIYFLIVGNYITALGIGLCGLVIIFLVDNLLSVYFFGKGLDVSPIFMIFSILGGIVMFGPLGFIFGPIILSLCISMTEMYKILILKKA